MKTKKNKNKRAISLVKLTIFILIVWVVGLSLGVGIVKIVDNITKNSIETKTFFLMTVFIGGSILIAIPVAIIITKICAEMVTIITTNLDKIAKGDFSAKYYHKSKNVYIQDVVNNYNSMVDQLNSVTVLKENFISTFSHEFKTPMVSIKGYAELLNGSKNLTEEEREYVKIIINESQRLSHLAENTMLITRLNSQSFITSSKVYSLDGQLEECVILFDKQLKEKKLEMTCDISPVKIKADKDLIKEVWINLLSNAIKYSSENSEILVDCFKEDDRVIVAIKDNGIGMSEETKSHIFEKFYQADNMHSVGGLGLGLNIVKSIVDLSGGEIECFSELGKGSTFIVRLPL